MCVTVKRSSKFICLVIVVVWWWCVLLIRIDLSSTYQKSEVQLLVMEEEHEKKRTNKSSLSGNRNGRTMKLARDYSGRCANDVLNVLFTNAVSDFTQHTHLVFSIQVFLHYSSISVSSITTDWVVVQWI